MFCLLRAAAHSSFALPRATLGHQYPRTLTHKKEESKNEKSTNEKKYGMTAHQVQAARRHRAQPSPFSFRPNDRDPPHQRASRRLQVTCYDASMRRASVDIERTNTSSTASLRDAPQRTAPLCSAQKINPGRVVIPSLSSRKPACCGRVQSASSSSRWLGLAVSTAKIEHGNPKAASGKSTIQKAGRD